MLDLFEIRERLKDRKLTAVADAIGIHKVTLYRIASGGGEPSYETLCLLSDYLQNKGKFAPKAKDGDG